MYFRYYAQYIFALMKIIILVKYILSI